MRLRLVIILVLAAAIRIYLDSVTAWSPADETVYLKYTQTLAAGGMGAYPQIVRMFLDDRGMWVFPNPLRWGYLAITTLASWITGDCSYRILATLSTLAGILSVLLTWWVGRQLLDESSALLGAALVATSPLQLALGRRALPDELLCAAVLASIGALLRAVNADTPRSRLAWLGAWVAVTTIAIAIKEQLLFLYPVMLFFWWLRRPSIGWRELATWPLPPFLYFAVYCLLARDVRSFFRIAHIITAVMGAPYAEQYQSGPPQRILIDLLAVAPIVTMIAIGALVAIAMRPDGATPGQRHLLVLAAGILLIHALLSSKNLRYLVPADPLLRLLAGSWIAGRRWTIALVAVNAIVELWLFCVIFLTGGVYDPVTDSLLRALHMLPR